MEKEKDIAFLKYNLQELKTNFQGKQEEVDSLKAENVNIENEVMKMRDQNNELKKQFEIKMENIALKNELLEKKIDSFEKQMLVSKKSFEDKISSFDENIDEINKLSAQVTISGKAVEENFNKLNCELKKQREDINSVRNCQETLVEKFNEKEEEIGTLKVTNINIENEMKLMKDQNEELRIHVERENNDLKNKNQLLETKLDSLGNQLVVEKQLLCNNQSEIINVKTQVGEIKKNLIENMKSSQKQSVNVKMKNNIDNLEHHVTNNILFCGSSKDIVVQWKLQDYQYHFEIGQIVYSPIYFTQVKGYYFKLLVAWSGEEKENLGLFLKGCRGSNYDKPLEPFRIPFSLEMVDNSGNILSKKISLSQIEIFTLLPGRNGCIVARGFSNFLSMYDVNNYILNDMLSIQCRLTPS